MKITKNPHLKHRTMIRFFDVLMKINAKHLCRLIYLLANDPKAGFYKKRGKAFLNKYIEYIEYVNGDNDKEVRRYRFNELMKDAPYITYSRADNILVCQEAFADDSEKPFYIEKLTRSDLIDNIVLALLVLHYDFGFGEKRIARIMTAWSQCNLSNAVEWAEKRTGYPIEAPKKDVYDWLMAITKKRRTATLTEQRTAKAGLEALRKYQQEVRHEEP